MFACFVFTPPFFVLQDFTALEELDLTCVAVQRELTGQTQATRLSLSANSVTAAITALPEMAQLSLDHVGKDITAHMEAPLHNLCHRLQVNIHIYQPYATYSQPVKKISGNDLYWT